MSEELHTRLHIKPVPGRADETVDEEEEPHMERVVRAAPVAVSAAREAQHEPDGGVQSDVGHAVVVLELLPHEDQALRVGRDSSGGMCLVLDLGLDVDDQVGRLDLELDDAAHQVLHEYQWTFARRRLFLGRYELPTKESHGW